MPQHTRMNLDEFRATLREAANCLALDRGDTGREALDLLSEAIYSRFVAQEGSRGAFAANRGEYGQAKEEAGVPVGIGLRHGRIGGQMARRANFDGTRRITAGKASMGFGRNRASQRKGQWFTVGTGDDADPGDADLERSAAVNQPRRDFWEITDADEEALVDYFEQRVEAFLAGHGPRA